MLNSEKSWHAPIGKQVATTLTSSNHNQAPECKATSPASSPGGSFTVQWGAQDPPTGQLKQQYDVDYKDGPDGTWIRWLSKSGATSGVFDKGEVGHTYYFRARAWARYTDLVDLYGAFSPGGDASTTVGTTASG